MPMPLWWSRIDKRVCNPRAAPHRCDHSARRRVARDGWPARPDRTSHVVSFSITRVWMHRAFGTGSVNERAVREGRENGVTVIDGGCRLTRARSATHVITLSGSGSGTSFVPDVRESERSWPRSLPGGPCTGAGRSDLMGVVTDSELDTLRRYLTAWGDRDMTTVLGLYHQDLELRWPGTHRLAGVHTGRDASIVALLELQTATQRVLHRVRSISDVGDGFEVDLVERWTVGDEVADLPRVLRFEVREGQISGCTVVELEPEKADRLLG